jgi:uncharacterized protein YecE (DUF72 family)
LTPSTARRDTIARIGTAGWSVPKGGEGSQLQRYCARFDCVEIDTSFYRPHRVETYARWAASAPAGFRFAVKAPRAVTHEARLRDAAPALQAFFEQIAALGPALGPVLLQLPPTLKFDWALAQDFFAVLRSLSAGEVVAEPRHPTWFSRDAEGPLRTHRIARVAADPAPSPEAASPGGWEGLRYWRLHGSPQMYRTAYGEDRLRAFAARLAPGDWCIFDNTASGAAMPDALIMQTLSRLAAGGQGGFEG